MALITISHEQRAYRDAQRHYEAKLAELTPLVNALLDASGITDNSTDEQIEAYAEQEAELHRQIGTTAARLALQTAEDRLLRWGHAFLKTQPGYDPQIAPVFSSNLVHIRQKALTLCMRIDAPPIVGYASWNTSAVCCACVKQHGLDITGFTVLYENEDVYTCVYCTKQFPASGVIGNE